MNADLSDRADHPQMIEDCMQRESKLSEWERGFIADMENRLANGEQLGPGQHAKLDDIWERVT